jgi:hypothetical protein
VSELPLVVVSQVGNYFLGNLVASQISELHAILAFAAPDNLICSGCPNVLAKLN